MTTISIDNSGKIEIPLEIRQKLDLTTAQPLNIEVRNGYIILQPLGQEPKIHRHGTALVLDTPPLGDLDNLIDNLREERIQSQLIV